MPKLTESELQALSKRYERDGHLRTTEICDLFDTIDALRGELAEAKAALERDRCKVAECAVAMKKALDSREWLTEGRGSYSYDDDKWHDEFAAAIAEIRTALEPIERIGGDWSNCPTSPEAIAKARSVGNFSGV